MNDGSWRARTVSSRCPGLQSALVSSGSESSVTRLNLLALETSTAFLSLAVCRGEEVVTRHVEAGQRHAEMILDSVSGLLERAGLGLDDLDGIAYGEGPGSFTGLRIGCGVVQGLAFARGLRVIGVGTLLALAEESRADHVYACLDARMGEVYSAAYCRDAGGWQVAHVPSLSRPQDVPVPIGGPWSGCGSGFAAHGKVLRDRLRQALDRVEPNVYPTASAVLRLAVPRFDRGEGEPPELAIPVYVRDKVALKKSEQ